jgi:hypothetical protein
MLTYVTAKCTPAHVWEHIPQTALARLTTLYDDWCEAYEKIKGPHTPVDTEKKNEARKAAKTYLSEFIARYLVWDPVTDADRLAMGMPLRDRVNTPGGEVVDTVEMSFRNDPRPGTHTQYMYYKILGAANRAKAPYHLLVLQTYIQGPGDPAPSVDAAAHWSRDIVNMSSPFKITFDSADAGKVCWYRALWEAKGGKQGRWSMSSAMIP